MKLTVNSHTTTKEIKDAFMQAFPGLKIEFVRNEHGSGEGSTPEDIIQGVHAISSLGTNNAEAVLELSESDTVMEIESLFSDLLGLNIQIFRKSGRVWIETVNTDQWTLEMQMDASHA